MNSNQSSEDLKCDNFENSRQPQCDKNVTSGVETNKQITRITSGGSLEKDTTSSQERLKCRKRIISGGSCQKDPSGEDKLIPPKPTRERITSGGSYEKNDACDIRLPHYSQNGISSGDFSRVEFSPEENLYTNSSNNAISVGFPCENLFSINLYENISLSCLPQYESNNVDQLYGSVRWSDETYASDNEDKFWLEMDKERDRFWSEMDKDKNRFWNGMDKERDREEEGEGEIECLQEDFSYELSSRGVR